jgi:hypothetical protein
MEQFIIISLEIYGALQFKNDIEFKVFKFDNSTCKNARYESSVYTRIRMENRRVAEDG